MQATESSEIKQYIDSRILVNEEKKKKLVTPASVYKEIR